MKGVSDLNVNCCMQSDWNRGAAYARDCIISNIIGIQNSIINNIESEQYKTSQALLISIEEQYGKLMTEFKG